jgi:hypothetical protein
VLPAWAKYIRLFSSAFTICSVSGYIPWKELVMQKSFVYFSKYSHKAFIETQGSLQRYTYTQSEIFFLLLLVLIALMHPYTIYPPETGGARKKREYKSALHKRMLMHARNYAPVSGTPKNEAEILKLRDGSESKSDTSLPCGRRKCDSVCRV